MGRKTYSFGAAALIAATTMTFASAETSGAFAQDGDFAVQTANDGKDAADPLANETLPVFVAEEIVQPIDADGAETAEAEDGADGAGPVARADAASLNELVSKTDKSFALSDEMQCLAGAVYFESRGEPLAGQLAVAQVIINRAESGQFPSSYCGVVYQRSQFSFVKNGSMPRIKTGSAAWKRAKAIARIAHEGQWDSEAQDSLYFHAKYVRPSWSRKKIARATINTHIFYR